MPYVNPTSVRQFTLASEAGQEEALDQALMNAVNKGDEDATLQALGLGANPNARFDEVTFYNSRGGRLDSSQLPAVSLAAQVGAPGCLNALARAGADLEAMDAMGWAPIHHAAWGPGKKGFQNTSEASHALAALIKLGVRLDLALSDGRTGLLLAAFAGHWESAWLLLAAGADSRALDKRGFGMAMAAALGKEAGVVEKIAAFGADVNAPDKHGVSPLMAAARDGSVERLREFIRAGADVNARNQAGMSAAMLAVDDGQERGVEALAALFEAGADLTFQDGLGRSAWDLAKDGAAKMFIQARLEEKILRQETSASLDARGALKGSVKRM